MAKRISPERELLKRWFKEFNSICCNKNLILETKELLDKPKPLNLNISEFQRGYGAALTAAVYVEPLNRAIERAHGIGVENDGN